MGSGEWGVGNGGSGRLLLPIPCSLFPLPGSLFPIPCSLFPAFPSPSKNLRHLCNLWIEYLSFGENLRH